jgi:hypothetical protein
MPKTNLDFTAYLWRRHEELDPEYIKRCEAYLDKLPRPNPFQAASRKHQASSSKRQAASNKLDKSK